MATIEHGKVVVSGDEWPFSDAGFQKAPSARTFAQNVAAWFTGGKPGKFLIYSTNWSINQPAFQDALKQAGHTVTADINATFTTEALLAYDGVIAGGNVANNDVLLDYVKSGGCVYLFAGTAAGGSATAEAAMWKTFLNAIGFKFETEYDMSSVNCAPLTVDHPITRGVKDLYFYGTSPLVDIDQSPASQIVMKNSKDQGVLGWFDAGMLPRQIAITDIFYDGKVKRVESDEFVEVSNLGFSHVDISDWLVHADDKGQDFRFPKGTILRSGQNFRIYTNEVHPETGGFSFGSKTAIWNNQGDTGHLSDAAGKPVSSKTYAPEKK